LVELGCDSITGDLVRLNSQVLGYNISKGCFTSPPNLASGAHAAWEIHGWIGEAYLLFSSSGCCSRAWQTVHPGHVDGPRGAVRSSVGHVLPEFVCQFVLIHFVQHFWLLEVCWTVREVSADGLFGADGPQVGLGWFVIQGAVLEVRVSDGPPCPRGQSAPSMRTVRPRLCRLLKSFAS
jgi:hypothetical protein